MAVSIFMMLKLVYGNCVLFSHDIIHAMNNSHIYEPQICNCPNSIKSKFYYNTNYWNTDESSNKTLGLKGHSSNLIATSSNCAAVISPIRTLESKDNLLRIISAPGPNVLIKIERGEYKMKLIIYRQICIRLTSPYASVVAFA
jgi:hypothetical protein